MSLTIKANNNLDQSLTKNVLLCYLLEQLSQRVNNNVFHKHFYIKQKEQVERLYIHVSETNTHSINQHFYDLLHVE